MQRNKSHLPPLALLIILTGLVIFLTISPSYAVDAGAVLSRLNKSDSCTSNSIFSLQSVKIVPALQAIIMALSAVVDHTMDNIFDAIVGEDGLTAIIGAAATLMILFYGISFLLGFTPFTLATGMSRLLRLGFVLGILSPAGQDLYKDIFVDGFIDGGNYVLAEIVDLVMKDNSIVRFQAAGVNFSWGLSGFSASFSNNVAAPVEVFKGLIQVVFTPRMIILIYTAFLTGPYGIAMGFAMLFAMLQVLRMVIKALEVYGVSIIAKAVLLGLGPMFITFLLFDKTKAIFMGWLQNVFSFTLQPIMMFTFIAFFTGLLEIAIWDMIPDRVHNPFNYVESCYVKIPAGTKGSPYEVTTWRYNFRGKPYEGSFDTKGQTGMIATTLDAMNLLPTFPIPLIPTLIVLVFAYIGYGMAVAATGLANSIAAGAVDLVHASGNTFNELSQGLSSGRVKSPGKKK